MGESRTVEPFYFFKIILQGNLEDKKLRIPGKFVMKFRHELSDIATLTVPTGLSWQLRLSKSGRKIWFDDGWNDFVKFHSISVGYFLVFKYSKNTTFNVVIFDMSACEIDYPSTGEEPNEMERETSLGILGSKAKSKEPIKHSKRKEPPSKKCKMEELRERDESDGANDHDLLALLENKGIFIPKRYALLAKEERERFIDIARLFKPKNPSFMVILKSKSLDHRSVDSRSNVYWRRPFIMKFYVLSCSCFWLVQRAPAKFARKYVNASIKFMTLQDSNGREWPVEIHRKRDDTDFFLSKGWTKFLRDNNIQRGDICVFELIRTDGVLLKVSVFRAPLRAPIIKGEQLMLSYIKRGRGRPKLIKA